MQTRPPTAVVHSSSPRRGPETTSRFVGGPSLRLDPAHLNRRDADHAPVLFSVGVGAQRLDALSWNVCWRYEGDARRGTMNNGFGRTAESVDDYRGRIDRTASRLEQLVRDASPGVLAVQEVARPGEPLHGVLDKAVAARLAPLGYTVFSSGELVTAVKGDARRLPLPPGLKRQGRTMDAVLVEAPRSVVVNVHWAWDRRGSVEEAATRDDLRALVRHLRTVAPGAPILVVGDTNRLPADVARDEPGGRIGDVVGDLGVIVEPPGPTNLRWNAQSHKSELTFADFAVWCPPSST